MSVLNLEPMPSLPRFYLAALEKNRGVKLPDFSPRLRDNLLPDFSPRLRDKIWARKAWVRG